MVTDMKIRSKSEEHSKEILSYFFSDKDVKWAGTKDQELQYLSDYGFIKKGNDVTSRILKEAFEESEVAEYSLSKKVINQTIKLSDSAVGIISAELLSAELVQQVIKIGDVVTICDGSNFTTWSGKPRYVCGHEYVKYEVIATDQESMYSSFGYKKNQDLIIVSLSSNITYRIASEFVKIVK